MELYSGKVCEISKESEKDYLADSLSHLNSREKDFLVFLLNNKIYDFKPIEVSKMLRVTNKTVINRCTKLATHGFIEPVLVNERITSYRVSEFAKGNEKRINSGENCVS